MIKKIENDFLSVEINEKGAELYSIKSKKTGIEYLWQGNPEFFNFRSLVLFPVCGRVFGGKYTYKNNEYEMTIHGFARRFIYETKFISNEEIEFELKANDDTRKCYPFDFVFVVRYVLNKNSLKMEFVVKNIGNEEMYFSYGGHPGFNVPFTENEKFEDYYIEFNSNELKRYVFSETCFDTGETEKYILSNKKLPLNHNLFDNDALFFETETDKVKLKSSKSKNAIEISYSDMTSLGLWHTPKTNAPFICIEPWHGIPSTDGVIDDIETKQHIIKLGHNKLYNNSYTIKIIEK